MKKIFLITTILLLTCGCEKDKIKENENENTLPAYDYKIDTVELENCTNTSEVYLELEDRNIYLVCLSEVTLLDENKTLKEYITNSNQSIDNSLKYLTDYLTISASLRDGGTTIYRDLNLTSHTKNGITMIVCNTTEGNKDIYIGPNSLDEESGFSNGYCGHTFSNSDEDFETNEY